MDSLRQNKVARLIQKELADIFQKECQDHFRGKLISVTTVRVSKDMSVARCYLSVFPTEGAPEVIQIVQKATQQYRGILGHRVGKQLRIVPSLDFFLDDSLDYIDNIGNLLNK